MIVRNHISFCHFRILTLHNKHTNWSTNQYVKPINYAPQAQHHSYREMSLYKINDEKWSTRGKKHVISLRHNETCDQPQYVFRWEEHTQVPVCLSVVVQHKEIPRFVITDPVINPRTDRNWCFPLGKQTTYTFHWTMIHGWRESKLWCWPLCLNCNKNTKNNNN